MTEDLTTLNKQAIAAAKKHMGEVAWPTVALTFATVGAFALTLALFAAGLLPAWAATLLIGALTYFSYTPLHEAVHNNIHGEHDQLTWLNHLCGYLVAPLIAVPYQSHRLEHFTHHRYTNQPDKDPDFLISGMGRGPFSALLTVLRFLWVQNTFFARQHWGNASRRERAIYSIELMVSIGWRAVFLALVSQSGAAVVVLLGYLIGGAFTAYWFAYRPHLPYKEPKRYRNTNSLIMPTAMKPLEWFWLGQNLHSIHHLFPRVPFYRYHALHREIEPVLRAHGTPIIGIFNRRPQ
ncbi:fatty acid desaturase family protein [Marinobacter sp. LQ44]|uniref:fatty acid desaturase family protein n=1 Tax=unclassified Marinobacter TaxID=83889 RepID=UPI000718C03B|nr:fatty acid desaturase [Marinobacter sp. LQ44]AMQ90678.1 fatty acid desaturase [Marinobacter sp. LQ44]